MPLSLVEDLSSDDTTSMVDGRTLPVPSVVEDADGIRALLLPATTPDHLSAHLWARAHAAGAAYLLIVFADEDASAAMLTETFIAERVENARAGTFGIDPQHWMLLTGVPSYRDVVGQVASEQTDAERPSGTFVHLHTHSEYSALDGLSTISEMIREVLADGQTALAVTDHANCAVHPELGNRAKEAGIKPIFGMEANLVEDRLRRGRSWWVVEEGGVEYEVDEESLSEAQKKKAQRRSDAKEVLGDYQHITLWAMDEVGLRNLWAMSTEGYRDGFYGRARIDYDTLTRHAEGVIASTGCLRGPLARPLTQNQSEQAMLNVARLAGIFGDRLYVEIHTNHLEEQVKVNHESVRIARQMGLPMIAAVDSHYAAASDRETHRAFLAIQQDKDLTDDTSLFAGGQDYHMKTEAEVREALAYLGSDVVDEAVANTVVLADRCTATLGGDPTPPVFSKATKDHPDPVAWDVERLIDLCLSNWERKITGKPYSSETAEARFEMEMSLLIPKQFCGYFLTVADYVNWAKEQGCLVGPGRGSGGGSLVAYLAGITELDPILWDLDFSRFLTEGRTSLPDFDVDFPTSWRERLKTYIRSRWGEDYVLSIGTVTRLKPKGALNDACRVLKGSGHEIPWTVAEVFRAAVSEADKAAAGTKVSWEEIVAQYEDIIVPMRQNYPEIMGLMERIVGRLRTYGKHPAGMVVSTDRPLTDLPMRTDNDGNLISQFDMVALEALGYVKFDLLTLRTLDTVQQCVDLVEEKFGKRVNVYDWREELEDPQVWEEVAAGHTLGIFQIETPGGTRMTQRYRPDSIDGLAADITIVRPGPMRSGLTETFLKRRDGLEQVSYPDPRLEALLGPTYGAPIYQEQVMGICMAIAGYTSDEADAVRKILGKKQVEKVEAAGQKFVAAAVERGMTRAAADMLWAQLAEFAKYGFGKAHAYGYAVLGFWTAWLKFHFPVQFITAALSTVDDDRLPEFINEARRMGYKVAPPDINLSRPNFTPSDLVIRYGISNVKGVGLPTAQYIVERAPYDSLEDFRDRTMVKGSPVDSGHLKTLVAVGAFDSVVTNRRAVEMQLERESSGEAVRCVFRDDAALGPGGLPCTFDWANEPDPPMESKGRGKSKVLVAKAPPKRCTIACRQYTKPEPVDVDLIQPYTADDIMAREREVLGTWLSGSPFDRLDPGDLAALHTAEDVNSGPVDAEYMAAGLVQAIRPKKDRQGNDYAFVTLDCQNGTVDAVCFASVFGEVRTHLRKDALVLAVLWKTDRGVQISALAPAL